jgi:hypothetical protein
MANAAGLGFDKDLARSGCRPRDLAKRERLAECFDDSGVHVGGHIGSFWTEEMGAFADRASERRAMRPRSHGNYARREVRTFLGSFRIFRRAAAGG